MVIASSLVFVLIFSISGIYIQMADAIDARNLLNTCSESYVCNNSFCYKYAAQEGIKKSRAIQTKLIQMINNITDTHKEIISAINQAQVRQVFFCL